MMGDSSYSLLETDVGTEIYKKLQAIRNPKDGGSGLPSFQSLESLAPKHRIEGKLAGLLANAQKLPNYADASKRRPGDIFINYNPGSNSIGHANMTSNDVSQKIDSVEPGGVRKMPIAKDRNSAIVYRLQLLGAERIATPAALLAEGWAGKVDYADDVAVAGLPFRAIGAAFGSCKFGNGAKGRLAKYLGREHKTPKNVICSEMCILAYQLCMDEKHPAFIKLDAKHTTPAALIDYFEGAGSRFWKRIAFKVGTK